MTRNLIKDRFLPLLCLLRTRLQPPGFINMHLKVFIVLICELFDLHFGNRSPHSNSLQFLSKQIVQE